MKMYAHIAFKKKKISYQSPGNHDLKTSCITSNLQYCILSIEYE